MRIFLISLTVLLTAALGTGCDQKAKELAKSNTELMAARDSLKNDLATRDTFIEDVTHAINEVYQNIELARAKEKMILHRSEAFEGRRGATLVEYKGTIIRQIAEVDSALKKDRARVDDLQARLNAQRKQYAGLQEMMNTLNASLKEREETIAQLNQTVGQLRGEIVVKDNRISEQNTKITEQEGVITTQDDQLHRGYYVAGEKSSLKKEGIIDNEGGFLWGLLGSTTVMNPTADASTFTPIDTRKETAIEVNGNIDEILPRRSPGCYTTTRKDENHTVLRILEPERFWQDKYLVIVRD